MQAFRALVLISILVAAFAASALPLAVYNVQSYGAVGDGVTDDTVAIRAAAAALQAAASASGVGGKLLFPPGKYLVFSPGVPGGNSLAVFTGLKGLNVISDGATIVIGRQLATSETGVLFGFITCTNVTIDGFTVTGPSLAISTGIPHGINMVVLYTGNVNVSMPNNKVQGVLSGLTCYVQTGEAKSRDIVVGNLYANDSVYGIAPAGSCDDVFVHNLTTYDIGRSYIAYGVKNHTVSVTSNGSYAEDVVFGAPLENIRLSYTSPAAYTFPGGNAPSGHARIRLHVAYDENTQGGPAFRLLKYDNVSGHTFENVRISGYVKGKPNASIGDTNGPIIGTVDSPNYWTTSDNFRNIELSDLRIENSKAIRFILPGLKGPFLIENVYSDNAIQLVQALSGGHPSVDPPAAGRYAIVNSMFPNLVSYYATEGAEPLDPINGATSLSVPAGWSGHTISNEQTGSTVTYTLPTATAGLEYSFVRVNAIVYVRPQATQTIRGGLTGYALYLDTVGDNVKLRCIVAGTWEVVASNGSMPFVP
jgi:hypothetical protein